MADPGSEQVALVQALYDAFGRGDLPGVLARFDPEIEWREAEGNPYQPSGEAWVGPDAVVENLFARLAGEWDAFTVHPERFVGTADAVVVQGRYTGRFTATGRDLDAQMCHVWRLRGERVVAFQQYVDTAQLRAVMGAA